MYECFEAFIEIIFNIHFQRVLYTISLILLTVIAVGTITFYGPTVISHCELEISANDCGCQS